MRIVTLKNQVGYDQNHKPKSQIFQISFITVNFSCIIRCNQSYQSPIRLFKIAKSGQQQIYTESMLDKYESFYKLSKSPECSIYTAFNRTTAQSVLMKRIKSKLSWNAMLAHRDIQLMNKAKIFPKMTEILKHKGQFFIVFQKPSGNSLSLSNAVERIPQETFYQLFTDLLEGIKDIQGLHPSPAIVPQWIYFHRNSLKVVHFQSFLDVQTAQKKHVITYGMGEQNPQFEETGEDETDFTPEEFKKNLVFNLGIMAYRFLTGKKQEEIDSKSKYQQVIANIREACQRQITKITNDSKLANFITKMISDNYFEVPPFNAVYNFFQSRVREKQRTKTFRQRSFDIQLQKIHIGAQKSVKQTKLKIRKCCLKEQKMKAKITKQKILDLKEKIGIKSDAQLYGSHKNKLFLPYISINRNSSCLNRHNPFLSTPHRQRDNKTQERSFGFRREIED